MNKRALAAVLVLSLGAAGYVAFRVHRGPTGSSTAWGGSVEAETLPEFAADENVRWVNGEPQTLAAHRGHPVLIEVWAPG
jgi:hypothetical protein